MPSSHANSLFFISTFITLLALDSLDSLSLAITVLLVYLYSSAVVFTRVHDKEHTATQVLAGMVFGACCAVAWFSMWAHLIHLDLPLAARQVDVQ
eukprot:m.61808 g.61808  ORF g.61808 m.61808 type:complete len:95 (+) comp12363_c0_seq1:343-627(+)